MLSIHNKIDRAQRLVQRLEEDAPYLDARIASLTPERQKAARDYASQLTARARAELERLMQESLWWDPNDSTPQAAD
jgi:hypothetical protein